MRGEMKTLRGMRAFREWAVRVATSRHNPDWVMPIRDKKQNKTTKLAVTLEAYNYYRTHSQQELPEIKDETVLSTMLEHEDRHIPRHQKFLRHLKLRLMPLRAMY